MGVFAQAYRNCLDVVKRDIANLNTQIAAEQSKALKDSQLDYLNELIVRRDRLLRNAALFGEVEGGSEHDQAETQDG